MGIAPQGREIWRLLHTDLQLEQTLDLKNEEKISNIKDILMILCSTRVAMWPQSSMHSGTFTKHTVYLYPIRLFWYRPLSTSSRAVLASWRMSFVRESDIVTCLLALNSNISNQRTPSLSVMTTITARTSHTPQLVSYSHGPDWWTKL